ncbi:hypothetical protein [Ponticaulis sp.]|uniref:hypothetical protein n=1 Tax=Ponticaulis sp. TaxID=2020902 RepID=UPI0025DADD6C|nr:hypothetical protein [Ponticaulis sp.]|tara:strand:+ start:149 stop:331 length:183 start_codon:yes stop_codon:yes gene_type:complete
MSETNKNNKGPALNASEIKNDNQGFPNKKHSLPSATITGNTTLIKLIKADCTAWLKVSRQ